MIKIKYILAGFFLGVFAVSAYAGDLAKNPARNPASSSANNLTINGFTQMKGDVLRAVFENTMMVGEYRNYRNITRTYNYTENHHKDGTTDYVEGRKKEDGRWKIIGSDKVCYKYPGSRYYTQTYCFFVYNLDGCYYKFSPDNMSFKRRPKSWDRWSSRAVRKDAGGSCDDPVG